MTQKILKNFRLSAECVARLEEVSELTGEDMTEIIDRAIKKYAASVALDIADEGEGRIKRIRESFPNAPKSGRVSSAPQTPAAPTSLSTAIGKKAVPKSFRKPSTDEPSGSASSPSQNEHKPGGRQR